MEKSAKTRPGADYSSDHELLIANIRLKLKKIGKSTKPFRYDQNRLPYDYTVEVTNRFRTRCDRVPEKLWMEVCNIVQEVVIKIILEKKCKKAKWLAEEALQINEKREAKDKGEKERVYTHLNAEFQRITRRDKKAFFSNQCKEIEGNNRMGKTRDLLNKIRDTRGTFHAVQSLSHVRLFVTPWTAAHQDPLSVTAKMGTIKGKKGLDPI